MSAQRVTISYLGEVEVASGRIHDGWSGGVRCDLSRVATRRVEPTSVEVHAPDAPTIHAGWGDRESTATDLPVYTERDADGVSVEVSPSGAVQSYRDAAGHRYPCSAPTWAAALPEAARLIREAAANAETTRPEVAAACASYRAILAGIRREHVEHVARWQRDVALIAHAFRRATVEVGEQTVPGLLCVRSSRGRLLGYAECWDGRWLGRVQRARRVAS